MAARDVRQATSFSRSERGRLCVNDKLKLVVTLFWGFWMFERYTEKARRVIFFSRHCAGELGSLAIEPHHILVGLIQEDKQLMIRLCTLAAPKLDDIRDKIRVSSGPGERLPDSVDLPLSGHAKEVLLHAADESKRLNDRNIGTEHLLLGLLRMEQTLAAEILREHGVDLNTVRDELRGKTVGQGDIGKPGSFDEMRRLANEARNLAIQIVRKADRIDAICDQLSESSSDQEGNNS